MFECTVTRERDSSEVLFFSFHLDRMDSIEEQLSTARYLRLKDWHVGFVGENFANLSDVNAAVVVVTRIAEK